MKRVIISVTPEKKERVKRILEGTEFPVL